MRNHLISLLSCAALLMACQPVKTKPIKVRSPSPHLKINDTVPIPPTSLIPPVPQAQPVPSIPAKKLSLDPVDQNNNQTEIDLAINTVTKSSKTETNSAQASPDITPKALAMPKTFNPTKIIGFATPLLAHNLGRANMVRKEGAIEVWQYQFASCVVDFFFYPVGKDPSQLILKTWDMRGAIIGSHLDRDGCRGEMNIYHQKFLSNSTAGR